MGYLGKVVTLDGWVGCSLIGGHGWGVDGFLVVCDGLGVGALSCVCSGELFAWAKVLGLSLGVMVVLGWTE